MKCPKCNYEFVPSWLSKGGQATGKSKVRGGSDYYRKIRAMALEKKKKVKVIRGMPRI